MPIYCYHCPECNADAEVYQVMGSDALQCDCGRDMNKVPTFPGLVIYRGGGGGGYPSRRKWFKGSAPYTTNATQPWSPANPKGLGQQ